MCALRSSRAAVRRGHRRAGDRRPAHLRARRHGRGPRGRSCPGRLARPARRDPAAQRRAAGPSEDGGPQRCHPPPARAQRGASRCTGRRRHARADTSAGSGTARGGWGEAARARAVGPQRGLLRARGGRHVGGIARPAPGGCGARRQPPAAHRELEPAHAHRALRGGRDPGTPSRADRLRRVPLAGGVRGRAPRPPPAAGDGGGTRAGRRSGDGLQRRPGRALPVTARFRKVDRGLLGGRATYAVSYDTVVLSQGDADVQAAWASPSP